MAMQVILTEDVPKLGDAGEIVRVKPGYARNYLIPQGKAMLATRGRVKELEHQRRVVDEKVKKEVGGWQKVADRLSGLELGFERHSGEEGKLFGSVTNIDIAGELLDWGFEVDRRKVELDEPIKAIGEYEVSIRLHREVKSKIKVKVTSAGEPPPEETEDEPDADLEERAEDEDEDSEHSDPTEE